MNKSRFFCLKDNEEAIPLWPQRHYEQKYVEYLSKKSPLIPTGMRVKYFTFRYLCAAFNILHISTIRY